MIAKFARLEFEHFTKPSKLDFLRFYQHRTLNIEHRMKMNSEEYLATRLVGEEFG